MMRKVEVFSDFHNTAVTKLTTDDSLSKRQWREAKKAVCVAGCLCRIGIRDAKTGNPLAYSERQDRGGHFWVEIEAV